MAVSSKSNEVLLKVGILSDSQAYPTMNDWGMSNLDKAFRMLADKKPDLILNAGDLADGTMFDVFTIYRQLMEKHFSPVPRHIGCAGNHDYWVPRGMERDPDFIYREMCRRIGQSDANPLHEVIGGFDFIAYSEDVDNHGHYTAENLAALEAALKKAVARDREKPVFVITHFPPADTMCGSEVSCGQPELRKLLNRYPQVISLSGHTHYPLEDEGCIWQGDFTAVTTSTLTYGCVSENCYNNCSVIIPYSRDVVQMMYMEIFSDRVEFHRYNVEDGREIKPDKVWSVAYPYAPEKAVYTSARKEQREAPEFPEGTSGQLWYDYGYLYLFFEAAQHSDFVKFYHVRCLEENNGNWELKAEERYINDFYRLDGCRAKRVVLRLPGDVIAPKKLYRFEITPEESFGRKGEPLVFERIIPGASGFKAGCPVYPQE